MTSSRRQFLGACGSGILSAGFLRRNAGAAASGGFSRYDAEARALLAQMTLEEKIGQMTQPDKNYVEHPGDIGTYHLGSVLSGGDSDPKTGNDLISWTDMVDDYQERALKTRLHIPLLYGVDAVHGHNNVIGAVAFPHNIGLGCSRNAELVEKAARITSEEVRATGINWAFAPCVTVPQDIRWGRTYEGFSQNPDVVKTLGLAALKGLQRESLADPLAVLGCAKHFIGDGGTAWGSAPSGLDQGDTRVDEATLRHIHLPGYVTTVAAGVGSIMPSYSSWNGVKCSASKRLMTDLLKGELGFEGFLISDYGAVKQLPGTYKQQIETSINAGMDMVMVPDNYPEFFNLLRALVQEDKVPMGRIDDAVLRILRVKIAIGLMDRRRSQLADRGLHRNFGSAEHRAVARACVRESMVLLKNEKSALPLGRGMAHIHVAGKNADNIGNQCGGWTIYWQGRSGEITIGTTILSALRAAAPSGVKITYAEDGSGGAGAGIGVAVIGETPYAEMMGDRDELRLSPEDVGVVARMKASGLRVVVVLVSGRPLVIDDILPMADAVIAAWLPGTEGDGVADVLFGSHKPTGKLSFSWPKGSSTSFHIGDPGYRTLFDFGYGLTYG
ncbi:MAG TPA: glycoside hydrolase family 3 protein [Bryobacteraceae bacterium]|nr:glycoside hydrolase family 3 protein [Bryobacteraceae bacterium]